MSINDKKRAVFIGFMLSALVVARTQAQDARDGGERAWVESLGAAVTSGDLERALTSVTPESGEDALVALARRRGVAEPGWLKARIAAQADGSTLVALGDSVSAGMASCAAPYFVCPWNSWSIGDEPTSLRSELAARSGRRVEGLLVAVPGAPSSLLPAQALAVYLASAFGLNVTRMTLLIGHNDPGVCGAASENETEYFRRNVALSLSILELVARRRGSKLLISSVTEVPALLRYRGLRVAGAPRTCGQLWKDGGHCPHVLGDVNPAGLAEVRAQIGALDDALLGLSRGRDWILYKDIFNAATRDGVEDPAARLSPYDCFHPSADGQAALGRLAWESSAEFFALPPATDAPRLDAAWSARLAAGARGDDWSD